jgi:hypothetical protein
LAFRTTSFIPYSAGLRRFAADFPRMKIVGVVAHETLREMFGRGEIDTIVTTGITPVRGESPVAPLVCRRWTHRMAHHSAARRVL